MEPLAVKGNSHVVNHAIKLKVVANFLHGFAELAAVMKAVVMHRRALASRMMAAAS